MNNENLLSKAGELHARRGEVREIAAIDLGSNSFHMIVARIVNGTLQVLSRLKQKVQLAEGLDENQVLSQAAIERGVNCLALFAERLQGFPAENVSVVGTYTLRRAINNEEFLRQAATVFPYPINIISGKTEAKTIYAGVCHTQPEMGRKFQFDKYKNLYEFWSDKITEQLNSELNEGELLLNLASNEYFKVVNRKKLHAQVVDFDFYEMKSGKPKTIVVYTKHARGLVVRFCAENNVHSLEELKAFGEEGYLLNDELSTENKLVFMR